MVNMRFSIEGFPELQRRISKLQSSLADLRPWLRRAGLLAVESVNLNFDAGGRPTWTELSEETRPGTNPEPLRDTGLLDASITDPATHEEGVFDLGLTSIETGTNLKYAGPQHFGTEDGHIPARPFMFLQEEDETKIMRLLDEYLDEALGPA